MGNIYRKILAANGPTDFILSVHNNIQKIMRDLVNAKIISEYKKNDYIDT